MDKMKYTESRKGQVFVSFFFSIQSNELVICSHQLQIRAAMN